MLQLPAKPKPRRKKRANRNASATSADTSPIAKPAASRRPAPSVTQRRTQGVGLLDNRGTGSRAQHVSVHDGHRPGRVPIRPDFVVTRRPEAVENCRSCSLPMADRSAGRPRICRIRHQSVRQNHDNERIARPTGGYGSPRLPSRAATPAVRSPHTGRRPGAETAEPSTAAQFLTVFPPIMLPMFMAVADQTIVATALPAITSSLGEIERAAWVVVSYLIADTIAAPVYGRLWRYVSGSRPMMFARAVNVHDRLGAVRTGCRTSRCSPLFRVLQGFGGGGLMTLSQALIGEAVPPRERGRYQGYLAGIAVTSNSFGPVAGGYLTQAFGWQSIYSGQHSTRPARDAVRLPHSRAPGRPPPHHFRRAGPGTFSFFVGPVVPRALTGPARGPRVRCRWRSNSCLHLD